jgi:hypothetical protein
VNLEPATAITQNFVPRAHLDSVLHFLRNKADQVSGFKNEVSNPLDLFQSRLKALYPDIELGAVSGQPKRKWEEVVAPEDEVARNGTFSFGFADDLDDDVV